jgi:RNase P subunit RPR2
MKTAICEKCGKELFPTFNYRFKDGGKYYCKWTCYNHRNDHTKEETAYEDNQDQPAERTRDG